MRKIFIIIIAITFFLPACNAPAGDIEKDCIPAPVDFLFPFTVTGQRISPTKVPMTPNWIAQLDRQQTGMIEPAIVLNMVIQPGDIIWFTTTGTILRFETKTKNLRLYDQGYLPGRLYVDKRGTLWGVNEKHGIAKKAANGKPYFLLRYDPAADKFELISSQILLTGNIEDVDEDSDGNLWFLTTDDELFVYDPIGDKASRVPFFLYHYRVTSMVIDRKNTIWFMVYNTEDPWQSNQVIRYRPAGDKMDFISALPDIRPGGGVELYVDHMDQLWTNDYGYLNNVLAETPGWIQMIRSPIFIHNRGSVDFEYQWSWAKPFYETNDGLLWFFSSAGLAHLNQAKKKWCLVTTAITGMVEDSENNLWIVSDGQIYKYSR